MQSRNTCTMILLLQVHCRIEMTELARNRIPASACSLGQNPAKKLRGENSRALSDLTLSSTFIALTSIYPMRPVEE
ncbi:hypothetical protein BDW69DRAFT_157698 [Aspergillus filifer]